MTESYAGRKFKTSITIYSDFDPGQVELSKLAREAEEGAAICTDYSFETVKDETLPAEATEFFKVAE